MPNGNSRPLKVARRQLHPTQTVQRQRDFYPVAVHPHQAGKWVARRDLRTDFYLAREHLRVERRPDHGAAEIHPSLFDGGTRRLHPGLGGQPLWLTQHQRAILLLQLLAQLEIIALGNIAPAIFDLQFRNGLLEFTLTLLQCDAVIRVIHAQQHFTLTRKTAGHQLRSAFDDFPGHARAHGDLTRCSHQAIGCDFRSIIPARHREDFHRHRGFPNGGLTPHLRLAAVNGHQGHRGHDGQPGANGKRGLQAHG